MNQETKTERYARWQKLIEEQETSGLSRREFCEQRNIVLSQFGYYLGAIKPSNKPSGDSAFVPIALSNKEQSAVAEIRLSLPNGFQCIFSSHIEIVKIKQVVEMLLSC